MFSHHQSGNPIPSSRRRAIDKMSIAVQAICTAIQVKPEELLPGLLSLWWLAWGNHPAYEAYYTPDSIGYSPPFSLLQPQVMGTWRHDPGRGGCTESYVIGTPQDVLSSLKWGERTYGGRFIGFAPIAPAAMPSRTRIATWMFSFSYKGAGGASEARMRLKAILPRQLHPWIHNARRVNAHPKWRLYPFEVDLLHPRRIPPAFASYRQRSKGEIWVEEVLPAPMRQLISRYMEPIVFWRCATGRVHPEAVMPLIQKHIQYHWVTPPPPVPRPILLPLDSTPSWRTAVADVAAYF